MNARDIRGTNHLPVTATGSHNFRVFLAQTRGGTWDRAIYRSELEYVASKGLKQLRLFWSPYAYFVDKAAFAHCVRDAAEMVRDAELEVMLVCTDAITASAALAENPFLHPWYDLLGTHGTRCWHPEHAENFSLMNGESGLLDRVVERDRSAFQEIYPRAEKSFTFGGWFGCPDPTYVCAYEMPDYPAVPDGHEALWKGYLEALDLVIGTFAEFGIVHSLDLMNEPTVTTEWAPFVAALTAEGAYTADAGLPLDASKYVPIAAHRLRQMLRWLSSYAADRWPKLPTTFGGVDLTSILYVHAALAVPVTTFFSFHSYSNGRYQEEGIVTFRDLVAANRPEWSSIELCCSEFGRWEQGEDMLPFYLHTFEKLDVGAMIWDVLEWPGFGGAFDAAHIPAGTPPNGSAYPVTGLVRSKVINGVHRIEERRRDLLPALEAWARGSPTVPPVWWQVQQVDALTFAIRDPRSGDLLPAPADLCVLWRWSAVPAGAIPAFTEFSPAWRSIQPFADFRCLGSWLDVPHTITVFGSAIATLPKEVLAELTIEHDVIVQPSFGIPTYAINAWPSLQWYEVGYLRLTFDPT